MVNSKIKIAIVGLGYVGLPIAIEFGKYFKTIGFDISKTKIQSSRKILILIKRYLQVNFTKQKI